MSALDNTREADRQRADALLAEVSESVVPGSVRNRYAAVPSWYLLCDWRGAGSPFAAVPAWPVMEQADVR